MARNDGSLSIRNWGSYEKVKGNLGLQLMSSVAADRDTKPPSVHMDFVRSDTWMHPSQHQHQHQHPREQKVLHALPVGPAGHIVHSRHGGHAMHHHPTGYGMMPVAHGARTLQMMQPQELPQPKEKHMPPPLVEKQVVMKTNYKADVVQHKLGNFQKQVNGLQESMNRVEALLQRLVNLQAQTLDQTVGRCVSHLRPSDEPRDLPDVVPPAELENEKTRRIDDLRRINFKSTQGIHLMGVPEGNFNFPSTGFSVVATGWEQDPKDSDEVFGKHEARLEDGIVVSKSEEVIDGLDCAVLGDFGIPSWLFGLSLPNPDLTQRLGTPNYMAPEQWQPNIRVPISYKTDSWSFACSIFDMLSGIQPWRGKSPDEVYQLVVLKKERPIFPFPYNLPPEGENVLEVKNETNDSTDATVSKSGKPKIKGVSMTELFTSEQIQEHINSPRLWVGQSKAKAEKNQAIGHSENENSCQPCKVEKLTFEPSPIYCPPGGVRKKQNAPYYTAGDWVRLKEEDQKRSQVVRVWDPGSGSKTMNWGDPVMLNPEFVMCDTTLHLSVSSHNWGRIEIQSKLDKEKILSIQDRGIGMTKEGLIKNPRTIAKSEISAFVEKMQSGGDLNLIGQFGVGSYSVHLAADYVEEVSKHYSDKQNVCPVADGAIQGHALSVVTLKQPEVDGLNGLDAVEVKVGECEIKAGKNCSIIVDHKRLSETTHQASCAPIDINCPESTEDPQNSDDVNQMDMHGNGAMAFSTEQAVAVHLEIRSSLHFVEVIPSSTASEGICTKGSRMEGFSHHTPENALGGIHGILDQKRGHVSEEMQRPGTPLYNIKALMKRVMQTWLPANNALLERMIFHFPTPLKTQKHHGDNLYEGPLDDICATAIRNCDMGGSLRLNVSEMIPAFDKGRFLAFGRVFSREVVTGKKVRILGPDDVLGHKKYLYVKSVQQPDIWKGKTQESVEDVPCVNTVAMVGLDQFITKNETLTNEKEVDACLIRVKKFSRFPIVCVVVQCRVASDFPKLVEGLKLLAKFDSTVLCTMEEFGEHIITGAGELHLEVCLKNMLKKLLGRMLAAGSSHLLCSSLGCPWMILLLQLYCWINTFNHFPLFFSQNSIFRKHSRNFMPRLTNPGFLIKYLRTSIILRRECQDLENCFWVKSEIWMRKPEELTKEECAAFYTSSTKDWEEHLLSSTSLWRVSLSSSYFLH